MTQLKFQLRHLGCSLEDTARFCNDFASKLISLVHGLGKIFGIERELGEESADERISSAVRVDDGGLVDGCDGDELDGGLSA